MIGLVWLVWLTNGKTERKYVNKRISRQFVNKILKIICWLFFLYAFFPAFYFSKQPLIVEPFIQNWRVNLGLIVLYVFILLFYFSTILLAWSFTKWKENNPDNIAGIVYKQNIFYNRSTNSAAFCAFQWMSLPSPFPPMQLK